MTRPIQAFVDQNALRNNLAEVKSRMLASKIWSVVKANGYGHGLQRIFDGLRGSDGFAVLELNEALTLRELGWRGPILLLEGVFDARELEECSRHQLWHTIHNETQIDWLTRHKTQQGHRIFLKMNSGMNRLGFKPQTFKSAWTRLNALPQVDEISLMTHFSDADLPNSTLGALQIFNQYSQDLSGEVSLSNSAATLMPASSPSLKSAAEDWARVGISLYGASVNPSLFPASHWQLQPVMTLQSQIIATQALKAGEHVGYGSIFQAPRDMLIGVVACGYADGYPRNVASGAPVLVQGIRTQTVGRVSMDMMCVDLEHLKDQGIEAGVGSEVTLWGRAKNGAILSIDDIAMSAQTISYELMCGLATRVPVITIEA
jgi:alanine racemase